MSDRTEFITYLVEAIAERDGVEPEELPYSLEDHIETDALSALVASDTEEWSLVFSVPDHDVIVGGNGEILIDGDQIGRPDDSQFE